MKFVFVAALSVVLMACKADSPSSSDAGGGETGPDGGSGVAPDNNIQVQVDGTSDGELFLYRINNAGDGLEQLNRVSLEDSDQLFDVETIPGIPFVRAQLFEGLNRWGIPLNVEAGQFIALSPLTQVVYNLAVRDGFSNLDRARVETLNQQVREGVAPGVNNLYAGSGALGQLPEDGGLAVTDPELILLHRLGLEAVAVNEGTEETPVTLDPSERQQSQLSVLLDDLGSGVVSGFGRNGFELNSLPYRPLSFIERYETALETYAGEYGNDAVNQLISDNTSGEEGPSTGESAYSRFVSRDARCDNTEQLDTFFSGLSSASFSADAIAAAGKYSAAADAQSDIQFSFDGIGIASGAVPTSGGSEAISVSQQDLYTCSLNETDNGNGGTQLIGLVRFVQDIDGDGELDEVTVVDDGDTELGVLIASDSGTDYAAFGDVNAQGGWQDPDDGQGGDEPAAACGGNYESLAAQGDVTVGTDTILAGEVSNPANAADQDASTSASLNVYIGLLGLGQAELLAQMNEPIKTRANGQVAALISVPDSIINLNVVESYTLDVYRNDEQLASNVGVSLADVDLGGAFNDSSLRRVVISEDDMAGIESFDEVRFRVNAGVLSTDIRTEVHEICYGTDS